MAARYLQLRGWAAAGNTMYSYLGNVQYRDNNGASYAQAILRYQPETPI